MGWTKFLAQNIDLQQSSLSLCTELQDPWPQQNEMCWLWMISVVIQNGWKVPGYEEMHSFVILKPAWCYSQTFSLCRLMPDCLLWLGIVERNNLKAEINPYPTASLSLHYVPRGQHSNQICPQPWTGFWVLMVLRVWNQHPNCTQPHANLPITSSFQGTYTVMPFPSAGQ